MKKIVLITCLSMSASAFAASYNIDVPTDSKASYTVINKGQQGDYKTITTKRVGSSGTSYSERAYDCSAWEVKYLGTGDSIAAMKSSGADQNMSPIIDRSIAYYVGREACK